MPTLTWTGKEDALRAASLVPFRLLESHPAAGGAVVGDPRAAQDNLLIHGDNLEALKALLPYYAGRVKCIYIDPPYNTGSAFEHYDDNLEHSTWLSMMYPRLELLRELLAEDGSIWVNLDDNEVDYAKVEMDEVFGRSKQIAHVIWQKKFSPQNDARFIDANHDHILVYAANIERLSFNLLNRSDEMDARYKNPDNDPRGPWTAGDALRKEYREYAFYEIITPGGRKVVPPPGTSWRFNKEDLPQLTSDNRLWFGKDGKGVPRIKRFLSEVRQGVIPQTIWLHSEVGNTQEAKKEVVKLNPKDVFTTPKPERLIKRILEIATNSGDLVLDSFLGSGTTAAVAHKMDRRWIGIEMGDHAVTHCLPRLQKVIDGEQGGISEAVNWKGGGGFRFVKLGETLFDAFGRLNPKVKFADLTAFIWWREARAPVIAGSIKTNSPFLGIHEGRGLYLLYNGILGDKRPKGGNVLTPAVLASLPKHDGQRVIYAEATTYSPSSLARMNITFKQIPYDLGSMPLLAEGALEYAAGLAADAAGVYRTMDGEET
jgi:adenine-specific DNA-methyltransferase